MCLHSLATSPSLVGRGFSSLMPSRGTMAVGTDVDETRPPDPPLAAGEDITHTNADTSHLVLGAQRGRTSTVTPLPPVPLPVVATDAPFTPSLDADPAEGAVRVEVLSCDVAGLARDEVAVELFQSARGAPHTVLVSTNAPDDAVPERWEAEVRGAHID